MGIDKRKSQKHKWRISEMQIFATALIGGALGVKWGMDFFHHKTKHTKFVIGIPLMLALNIIIYGYLLYYLNK
jgi:uncharacterized membrane protein YsdA (DUF1294 family)